MGAIVDISCSILRKLPLLRRLWEPWLLGSTWLQQAGEPETLSGCSLAETHAGAPCTDVSSRRAIARDSRPAPAKRPKKSPQLAGS